MRVCILAALIVMGACAYFCDGDEQQPPFGVVMQPPLPAEVLERAVRLSVATDAEDAAAQAVFDDMEISAARYWAAGEGALE